MEIRQTGMFKKDIKRCRKQGKNLDTLKAVITTLASPQKLLEKHKQHSLHGVFDGWEECHVAPDWLLIFRYYNNGLELFRTGSHSELFGK